MSAVMQSYSAPSSAWAFGGPAMFTPRTLIVLLILLSAMVMAQSDVPGSGGIGAHMTELSDDELSGLGGDWRAAPEADNEWRKKKDKKASGRIDVGVDYEQMQKQLRYQDQLHMEQNQRNREPHPGQQIRVHF